MHDQGKRIAELRKPPVLHAPTDNTVSIVAPRRFIRPRAIQLPVTCKADHLLTRKGDARERRRSLPGGCLCRTGPERTFLPMSSDRTGAANSLQLRPAGTAVRRRTSRFGGLDRARRRSSC
jgi:hypothetical protein